MDAAVCVLLPAGPTTGATSCPKAGHAAAANVTNKRKFRCLCMPSSLSCLYGAKISCPLLRTHERYLNSRASYRGDDGGRLWPMAAATYSPSGGRLGSSNRQSQRQRYHILGSRTNAFTAP